MDRVSYDYRELKGRIKEKCGTQAAFADIMGISDSSLSNRLNNKVDWGLEEIEEAICILAIPETEIHTYFFTHKV